MKQSTLHYVAASLFAIAGAINFARNPGLHFLPVLAMVLTIIMLVAAARAQRKGS